MTSVIPSLLWCFISSVGNVTSNPMVTGLNLALNSHTHGSLYHPIAIWVPDIWTRVGPQLFTPFASILAERAVMLNGELKWSMRVQVSSICKVI